ncbi:MAG: MOSC domain-containing protein [Rhodobacteraceae bacterium]|nr:MOSC domain-containing protein [Paracoccaceae bacterium]
MPALKPTDYYGTITWLGRVPDRDTRTITTLPMNEMKLGFAGLEQGEIHAGLTRPSCSRVLAQYPRDTEIRNTRQLSLICAEESAAIAAQSGLDTLDPAWLGASIVLSGIPDFSHLPPGARLQSENGTTLTIDVQNRPCLFPALSIEAAKPGHGKDFKSIAKGLRGVTGWVERPGTLLLGDKLRLHIPDQRSWAPGD